MKPHILLLFITENLLTVDGAEAGHTTVGLVIAVVLTVVLVRFNNQYCHTLDLKLITRVNILLSFVVLKSFKSAHYLSFLHHFRFRGAKVLKLSDIRKYFVNYFHLVPAFLTFQTQTAIVYAEKSHSLH